MIEAGIENVRYKARRVVSDDPHLLRLFQVKVNYPYLLQDMKMRGIAVREARGIEAGFLEHLPAINLFLREYLEQNFDLSFTDWAQPSQRDVYFTDSIGAGRAGEVCAGSFYMYGQNIVLSDAFLRNNDTIGRMILFVSTLMHELVHMQSVHYVVRDPKQKVTVPAFARPVIIRQGLHYRNGAGLALDEAFTEMLSLEASKRFLSEYFGKEIEVPNLAYLREMRAYITFEEMFLKTRGEREAFGLLLVRAKFGVSGALEEVFSRLRSIAKRHSIDEKQFESDFFNLSIIA